MGREGKALGWDFGSTVVSLQCLPLSRAFPLCGATALMLRAQSGICQNGSVSFLSVNCFAPGKLLRISDGWFNYSYSAES